MKKKMIVALALLAAVSLAAFASPVMYVKGAVGYAYNASEFVSYYNYANYSDDDIDVGVAYHAFAATPTFGIAPWRAQESKNAFLRGLSFEISVDFDFGKGTTYGTNEGYSVNAYAIKPGVMAVYSRPSGKVIPYGGIGVSVPIALAPALAGERWNYAFSYNGVAVNRETYSYRITFDIDLMLGIGYAVTENIMPVFEVEGEYDFVIGGINLGARLGCVFKFGG